MSDRPKTRGGKTPRGRSLSLSGPRRARDDEEKRDSDHNSDKSDDDVTDLVKTKGQEMILALQSAIDGLSQSQLLPVKDMVQKAAQPTRARFDFASTSLNCR